MGRVDIEAGNPQAGLEFLNRAQSMAIEVGNDEQKAQILQAIGMAYSTWTSRKTRCAISRNRWRSSGGSG